MEWNAQEIMYSSVNFHLQDGNQLHSDEVRQTKEIVVKGCCRIMLILQNVLWYLQCSLKANRNLVIKVSSK